MAMVTRVLDRRDLLARLSAGLGMALAAGGSVPAWAQAAQTTPFDRDTVLDAARDLAARAYAPPATVPLGLRSLDYDGYRQIRYRSEEAIWGRARTKFAMELFAPGYLFRQAIDIAIVESGRARPLRIDADSFDAPSEEIARLLTEFAHFAGFRLHYPLNSPDYRAEFMVFQGASYFRAVSAGQVYGLSARGLAIDVGEPSGEEFPIFRRFWIERPSAAMDSIVVHALLDSPRVTGAYRFGIYPGDTTVTDVEAVLFPRARLTHVGIAPLTSMFLHGSIDGPDRPDYRPAVHDSQGLAMRTGWGERIWRPLNNPRTLQISAFRDENPRGFGLIQRDRRFDRYQDLEATYEGRPSAWIRPNGSWGRGHVVLVEIPTPSEGNDNIVAYWRPDEPLEPGSDYRYAYRLTWPGDAPPVTGLAPVVRSGYGATLDSGLPQVAVDYGPGGGLTAGDLEVEASASSGRIVTLVHQDNPATGGWRVFMTVDPDGASASELRLRPTRGDRSVGETWLYRWVRP